jgi:hypothetical protein
LSLQSTCRLVIRKRLGIYCLDKVDQLGLVKPFDDFVAFRELFISAGELIIDKYINTISTVNKVLREVTENPPVRGLYANCPAQALSKKFAQMAFLTPDQKNPFVQDHVQDSAQQPPRVPLHQAQGGPPPPPPPPPPIPPRPGFWRFPGAEFSDKGVHH